MKYLESAPASLIMKHLQLIKDIADYSEACGGTIPSRLEIEKQAFTGKSISPKEEKRLHRLVEKSRFPFTNVETCTLLGKLLTDPRMETAWRTLSPFFVANAETQLENDRALCLFQEIEWALAARAKIVPMTPGQQRSQHKAIAECAERLEDLISAVSQYDEFNSISCMDNLSLTDLLEILGANTSTNIESLEDFEAEITLFRLIFAKRLRSITPQLIILAKIANENSLKSAKTNLIQSGTHSRYLQRILTKFFESNYEKTFDGVVASIISIVLDLTKEFTAHNVLVNRTYPAKKSRKIAKKSKPKT